MGTRHAIGFFTLLAATTLAGCQQGPTWTDGASANTYGRCMDSERCADWRIGCQCRTATCDTCAHSRQARHASTSGDGTACETARPTSRDRSHTRQSSGYSRPSRDRREADVSSPQTRPQPKPPVASTPTKPAAPRKHLFGNREDEKPPVNPNRNTWLPHGRGGT